MLFDLGRTVSAIGAADALQRNGADAAMYLKRHAAGDWGEVCEEDKQANNAALNSGGRLMSEYFLADETRLWIITDAVNDHGKRQATTFMLPDEY